MRLERTTPVPNVFFEDVFPTLSVSQLKILLVVIRQTYGWVDTKTGGRKKRDRLTHRQFMIKTGLSRRSISEGIASLLEKNVIAVTDQSGHSLKDPERRKGTLCIYYECVVMNQEEMPRMRWIGDIMKGGL